MSFLATPSVNDWGENVFKLTPYGLITVGVLIALLIAIAIVLRPKTAGKVRAMATTQLVFSAAAMALAIVTAEIKFTRLPMGGFAYGLLQFLADPVFYSPLQLLTDYPLAFGALGLSGIFYEKKHGLLKGYIVGVLGRYIFAVISGVVFFGNYAPEGTPALVYSLGYNATYIVPEAVATMIIISIPAVSKAMSYVRSKATYSSWNAGQAVVK